jgi:hypothetical protein
LKPAQANCSGDPISKKKKNHKKGAGVVAQGVGPEFQPPYQKKKKKSGIIKCLCSDFEGFYYLNIVCVHAHMCIHVG